MADVGVLNLQIHSNADEAEKSLGRLVDALSAIRNAVGESEIGKTASALARINKAVTVHTIVNVNGLAAALKKVKEACNFTFPNLSALNRINQVLERVNNAGTPNGQGGGSIGAMQESVQAATDGFGKMDSAVREVEKDIESINQDLKDTVSSIQDSSADMKEGFGAEQGGAISNTVEGLEAATEKAYGFAEAVEEVREVTQRSLEDDPYIAFAREWNARPLGGKRAAAENISNQKDIAWIDDTIANASKIDLLVMKVESMKDKLYQSATAAKMNGEQFARMVGQIQKAEAEIEKLREAERELESITGVQAGGIVDSASTDEAVSRADQIIDDVDNMINSYSKIQLLQMKADSMKDRLIQGKIDGKLNGEQVARLVEQIQKVNAEISGLKDAEKQFETLQERVAETTDAMTENVSVATRMKDGFASLGSGVKKLMSPLTNLINRFKRIAGYRMLRAVLKHITEGFSEGVEHVYQYSKAVGTSLAPAMDSAVSSLQWMKNSIGAAVAPAIQALVPVLQNVVSWFVQLVNYANQFLALATGMNTWTRALMTPAEAYANTAKQAKAAHKANKDLLADWDELNIIQSNSSSAAGTGPSAATTDYTQMFEEVNDFEDGVKRVFNFIDEHLDGIKGVLTKLGAMLLGLKFSKAFTGVLGDIGKFLAGGMLLELGIELSYGAGFEAGKKGYFSGEDILGAVGGALASAIGGSLISTALGFGPGVGLAIGLGVGIVATLVGWVQGQADFMDRMKWGNREMSVAQIQDYVKSKFTFDVESEITVLGNNITDRENAKTKLETSVNDFTKSLTLADILVGMKADGSETAIQAAYEKSKTALKDFEDYINTNESLTISSLKISPIKDAQGKDLTKDIIGNIAVADTTLKQYMEDLGRELGDAMALGERMSWAGSTKENALELMKRQREILDQAKEYERDLAFEQSFQQGLEGLTRDNAKEVFAQQQEMLDNYREKFFEDRYATGESYRALYAKAQAMVDDAVKHGESEKVIKDLEKSAETYYNTWQEFASTAKAWEAWNQKMHDSEENMKADWIKALTGKYGLDSSYDYSEPSWFQFGYRTQDQTLVEQLKKQDSGGLGYREQWSDEQRVQNAIEALKSFLEQEMGFEPDYIQDIAKEFGIGAWDIATNQERQNLVDAVRRYFDENQTKQIFEGAGISADEIGQYLGKITVPVVPEVEPADAVIEGEATIEFDNIKDEIDYALRDSMMTPEEYDKIIEKYGEDAYQHALELMRNGQWDDYDGSLGARRIGVLASAGMADVGGMGRGSYTYAQPSMSGEADESQKLADGVERGVQGMRNDQREQMGDVISLLTRLLNKQWNINLTPGSDWGKHMARSREAYENMIN